MRRALVVAAVLLASCGGGARSREIYRQEIVSPFEPSESSRAAERLEAAARASLSAQELTLTDCLRLALYGSESLRARAETIYQVETRRQEAIASILPQVSARGRFTRDSDVVAFGGRAFTPQERTEYWFTVTQPLFQGAFLPTLDVVREAERIETLRFREERDRLLFDVASDFYQILALEKDVQAIDASRASAEEHVRVLGARRAVGEASEADVLLGRARRDEADARLIQARSDRDRARVRLSRLLDLSPLPETLRDTYEVEGESGDVPHLVDRAVVERTDLERGRAELARAEAERRIARAEFLPSVDATFSRWAHMIGGFQQALDWTLTIGAEWKLFDGGARFARNARAESVIRQRQMELRDLEERARADVEDAVLAFASLNLALRAYESRAEAATAAATLVAQQFAVGEATNLDVLTAQEAREDAVRNLERAKLARKLAAMRIRLAVGDLELVEPVREIVPEEGP